MALAYSGVDTFVERFEEGPTSASFDLSSSAVRRLSIPHPPPLSPGSRFSPPPFQPPSPLPSGHHRLSPAGYGYWQRPPISMRQSWSPSNSFAAPPSPTRSSPQRGSSIHSPPSLMRGYQTFGSGDLTVPVLQRSSSSLSSAPLSPMMRMSPHNTTTPASPHDFCPPLSPRSDCGMRRRTAPEKILSASPSWRETAPATEKHKVPAKTTTTEKSHNKLDDSVQVVVMRERSACEESPLHGDKILAPDMDETASSSGSITPLPFEREDPTTLMQLSDDLLQLPIAPVGPFDELLTGK